MTKATLFAFINFSNGINKHFFKNFLKFSFGRLNSGS